MFLRLKGPKYTKKRYLNEILEEKTLFFAHFRPLRKKRKFIEERSQILSRLIEKRSLIFDKNEEETFQLIGFLNHNLKA